MMMIDSFFNLNFVGAVLYTLLMMIIAFYYYNHGKIVGIKETLTVLSVHEPEALRRLQLKLKEILGVTTES